MPDYIVLESNRPTDCYHFEVHESWNKSCFHSKRAAEIHAFHWAYPYDIEDCIANAPEMELDKDYDYSMNEFPVFMKIVERKKYYGQKD